MNFVKRVVSVSFATIVSIVFIGIILFASYVIGGHDFLVLGRWGTDMKSALSMALWYDSYFPHVPFWYPVAGGGVSFVNSYPTFSFVLVSIINRISSLNATASFTLLGFMSVPAMAIGIYTFVAVRTKRYLMGFLAGMFYLISPIAWVWLSDWGFYAEAVSHIFVMPAIIFWDFYVSSVFSKQSKGVRYGSLVLSILFVTLSYLTHFGTGYALIGFLGVYLVGYGIRGEKRLQNISRAFVGLVLLAGFVTGITLYRSYSYYRYSGVVSESSIGGGGNYEQIKASTFSPKYVSGLVPSIVKSGKDYIPDATRHISFLGIVSVLALVGVVFSFKSKRALTFALFSLFAVFVSTNARFLYFVLLYVPSPFNIPLTWRWTFIALRFTIPYLAAFGLVSIGDSLLFFLKSKRMMPIKYAISGIITCALVGGIALQWGTLTKPEGLPYAIGSSGLDFRNIWNTPQHIVVEDETLPEGVLSIPVAVDNCQLERSCAFLNDSECLEEFRQSEDSRWCHSAISDHFPALGVKGWCQLEREKGNGVTEVLCDPTVTKEAVAARWNSCLAGSTDRVCSLMFDSFTDQITRDVPAVSIVSSLVSDEWFNEMLGLVSEKDPDARLDYSPYLSGLGMLGPNLLYPTDLSQIYIYTVAGSSLNSKYYTQYANALFLEDAFYQRNAELVENLTSWFGVDYLFAESHTKIEDYYDYGWSLLGTSDDGTKDHFVNALERPVSTPLAELSDKSTVLVVGDGARGAYDDVYRISMYGMLAYDNYVLVRGDARIDDYTSADLEKFDVVVLHGYSYNRRSKADTLLVQYVESGGSVFIDTGWQYVVPEWDFGKGEGLAIVPFDSLSWKSLGVTRNYHLENPPFDTVLDVSKFAPLDYQGSAWGVSTATRENLASWARPLVTVDDSVLLAVGEKGKGRIVWSGMNILNHIKQGESLNAEELRLMKNVFSYLADTSEPQSHAIDFVRPNPDRVEFTLPESRTQTKLLWKEAYYPDFKAHLVDGSKQVSLTTYRAGPSFVYIDVPATGGTKIVYEYKTPIAIRLSQIVSLVSFILLIGGYFELRFRKESVVRKTFEYLGKRIEKISNLWRRPVKWLNNTDNDEEY